MVRTLDQTDMNSQLITIDQFALVIYAIQESVARLGLKIEKQQVPRDQVQDGDHNDLTTPPPPSSIQQTASHVPLVLHGQVEMNLPSSIVHALSTYDTCKTRENFNFLKKGKMVISVKNRNFSRSWMMKRTSPLESSREI